MPKPLKATLGKIGLGCVTFGREINPEESFAIMDHAREKGVNFFDTAAGYGEGESERIIGAWLASRRPDLGSLKIATKLRPPYSPALIEASIAQSRRRLGLETIDLFYLHRWAEEAADPEILATLDRALRDGRIRALGASNFTAAQLERVLQIQAERGFAPMQATQNNHNFAVRTVDDAMRRVCAQREVAVVTYSPLGAGFLTGKHKAGVETGSRFDVAPGHQNIYFSEEGWRRLARLEALAARSGQPLPLLALAWVFHQAGVTTVLVGGRKTTHLDQALAAQAFADPAVLAELNAE